MAYVLHDSMTLGIYHTTIIPMVLIYKVMQDVYHQQYLSWHGMDNGRCKGQQGLKSSPSSSTKVESFSGGTAQFTTR